MKSIFLLMITGLVCLGIAGCNDDDDEPAATMDTTNAVTQTSNSSSGSQNNNPAGPLTGTYGALNVSGKWLGWYELGGVKALLSLKLTQNGPIVGGTYTFSDAGTGSIASGLITGNELSLVMTRNGATFRMVGRVDPDAPSYIGTWEDDERSNSGTFSLR